MARGSTYSLPRIEARRRRVRAPREAGWPRRIAWLCWHALASLARPALFALLAGTAGILVFDGLRHLEPGTPGQSADPVSRALASLAPDAASATGLWSSELDAAMRPRVGTAPDSVLAMSLLAAFEDIAGRERYASLVWADAHSLTPADAESVLRAMPVWVRYRELDAAWSRRLGHPSQGVHSPGVASLMPPAARARLERANRLYGASELAQSGFFAGHEEGALNLALLPGLDVEGRGEIWLPDDQTAVDLYCGASMTGLECALARIGSDPEAGPGARVLRAALLTGHAGDGLRAALESADGDVVRSVAAEMGAVARQTSHTAAIRLAALAETPQDAARLGRLSAQAGPRTLALAHLRGREALTLDRGESSGGMTPAARDRFILASVLLLLAIGMVLAALGSALSVALTGRAGLGQRIDIRMRELLLGRKT